MTNSCQKKNRKIGRHAGVEPTRHFVGTYRSIPWFVLLAAEGRVAALSKRTGFLSSSKTRHGGSFGRTRFKYCQEPRKFQGLLEVRAEVRKLKPSAFGFCLAMRFDQCTEARAVNIIDLLKINDNSCGA